MADEWSYLVSKLRTYPAGVHELLRPCPEERLAEVQLSLGKMPNELVAMLRQFNGAKLFCRPSRLLRLFGISSKPPLPSMEWGTDFYIDVFTPKWRVLAELPSKWAIGMMNYGGLILMEQNGILSEWDTSEKRWLIRGMNIQDWIDKILKEGDEFLAAV